MRTRTRIGWVGLFIIAAMTPSAFAGEFPEDWFFKVTEERRAELDKVVGQPMPAMELTDWQNGELKQEDLKGKIVVVDFWATWCGPCIASIPHNNEVAAKYKDKGVVVLGVCTSRGQEKFEELIDKHKIAYHSAKDPENKAAKTWGVQFYPTYAVVDRQGVVRAIGLRPDGVDKVLEKLLAGTEQAKADDKPAALEPDKEWLEGNETRREKLAEIQGKPAPAIEGTNWLNGKQMTNADLKGKIVILDFWATWCGPCIAAIPHTNEMAAKYKDQGVVIIGVCHPRAADKMADTVKDKDIKYTVFEDVEGKVGKAFSVDSYPDYYIIDREGNLFIADCKNGSVEKALEALLKAQPAPEPKAE